MRRLAWIAVVAVVAVGCRGSSRDAAKRAGSGSGSGSSAARAVAGSEVELRVDGAPVRRVAVTEPTLLAALVPPTPAWVLVEAAADDGRFLELTTPATTYPGAEIRLYPRDGRVGIGVFRPPVTGVPAGVAEIAAQPVVELTNVLQIEVWTHAPPQPPAKGLTIEAPGRPPRELDLDDLEALTEFHERRARGWLLRDLIALANPKTQPTSVKVVGESGVETVSAEQLAQTTLIKRNQKGELVFQRWEPGGDRATVQVRGVTRIVVGQ